MYLQTVKLCIALAMEIAMVEAKLAEVVTSLQMVSESLESEMSILETP